MAVYPNPANTQLFVSLRGKVPGRDVQLFLYDCTSRIVKEFEASREVTVADISMLPEGVYYLKGFYNGSPLPVQKVDVIR